MVNIDSKIIKLREQVHRQLEGGDVGKDSRFDPREIEEFIRQSLSTLIKKELYDNYKVEGEWNPSQYIVTFTNVPMKYDSVRGEAYINIPAQYLSLPSNRGLYSISQMSNMYDVFIPMASSGRNFTRMHGTPALQTQQGYTVEGKKAYFIIDLTEKGENAINLRVQLVTSDSKDVDINIPTDMQAMVIMQATEFFMSRGREDKVADDVG